MTKELWHPDIVITENLAKCMIENQFPMLSPVTIKCIGEGWDNKVFLVNEKLIFRLPHRKVAAPLIETENVVLQHLKGLIHLEIPSPEYIGKPDINYPYYFHGYPMITGQSGCHAKLSGGARRKSIVKLATFLKQLHSIPELKASELGVKDSIFDRTNIANMIEAVTERVKKINARNIGTINLDAFNEEIEIATSVNLSGTKVLVHGDLYCRHLMFDNEELVGIIDWGDVAINHPAVDLSVVFSFYPTECHQDFFTIYGAIDENTFKYAKFLGLYSSITVMLYGDDTNELELVQEAKASIRRINPKLYVNN